MQIRRDLCHRRGGHIVLPPPGRDTLLWIDMFIGISVTQVI